MQSLAKLKWFYGITRKGPLLHLLINPHPDFKAWQDAFRRCGLSNIAGALATLALIVQFKMRGLETPWWAYFGAVLFAAGAIAGWAYNTLVPMLERASVQGDEWAQRRIQTDLGLERVKFAKDTEQYVAIEDAAEKNRKTLILWSVGVVTITSLVGWIGFFIVILFMGPIRAAAGQ